MSGFWVGVCTAFAACVVIGLAVDRESREALFGFLLAVACAPVLLLAQLAKLSRVGGANLSAEALSRFAWMKRKGGGKAWAFFYNRRGVIFVRGLKDNEPVPSIKVRDIFPEDIP